MEQLYDRVGLYVHSIGGGAYECIIANETTKLLHYEVLRAATKYEAALSSLLVVVAVLGTKLTLYTPAKYICNLFKDGVDRYTTANRISNRDKILELIEKQAHSIRCNHVNRKSGAEAIRACMTYAQDKQLPSDTWGMF